MANTQLSTLIPLVRVAGCPTNLMLQAIRQSCKQFLLDTEIWEETLADINTVADQADYTLTPAYSANARFIRITKITINDSKRAIPECNWSLAKDNTLTFDPEPTVDDDLLKVTVVYTSTDLCAEVIDWILADYSQVISAGAEIELKSNPVDARNPVRWYDPNGFQMALAEYDRGVGRAKMGKLTQGKSGLKQINLYGAF